MDTPAERIDALETILKPWIWLVSKETPKTYEQLRALVAVNAGEPGTTRALALLDEWTAE